MRFLEGTIVDKEHPVESLAWTEWSRPSKASVIAVAIIVEAAVALLRLFWKPCFQDA